MSSYPVGIPVHICELFEQLALQAAATQPRWSARNIFHVMRWQYMIKHGDAHFKINNNYSARLARWFMKKHPQLGDFFEVRNPPHTAHDMHGHMHSSVLD